MVSPSFTAPVLSDVFVTDSAVFSAAVESVAGVMCLLVGSSSPVTVTEFTT